MLILLGEGDLELLEVDLLLLLVLLLLLLLLLVERDSDPDLLGGRLLLMLLLPVWILEGRGTDGRGRGGGEADVGGTVPLRTTTLSST